MTRVATLPDGPLDEPLRIGPLPLAIKDGSVRVRLQGGGQLRATAVRVTLDAPDPDPNLRPAHPEELQDAEREVERLRAAVAAARKERGRIEALSVVARPSSKPGEPPPPSPADARLELLTLRDRKLRELDTRLQELAVEQGVAGRKLGDLRAKNALATSMRQTEPDELRKAVEVVVRGARPAGDQPTVLQLEYQVHAARWAPAYTLRLDAEMSGATLEMRAAIAQYTGEDWRDVQLTLSTARLSAWADLPELQSIRIGRQQPRRSSDWRPPPAGAEGLFDDFDRARQKLRKAHDFSADSITVMSDPNMRAGGAMPMTLSVAAPVMEIADAVVPMAPPPQSAPSLGAPAPSPGAPAPVTRAPSRVRARAKSKKRAEPKAEAARFSASRAKAAPLDAMLGAVDDEVSFGGAADEPPQASMSRSMQDFGALRLVDAEGSARGKLVVRTREQLYVEYISETTLEVDIHAALRLVHERTRKLDDATLPPGCLPPAPSGFDYVYRTRGRIDAPSDATFHNVPVTSTSGTAHPRFVVVPRESQDVFRFVEMHNPLGTPLLHGPIDVVVGGDFMLTSTLDRVPKGGVLRLGLGVEQRIKVSRNTHFSEKTGGLLGGKLELRHRVEIGVENLLPREVEVEVRERVPVVREDEDDIRVEEKDVAPPWRTWKPDEQPDLEGGRRWQLSLPPGEKRNLQASYTIRISSKHELVGGNRREA